MSIAAAQAAERLHAQMEVRFGPVTLPDVANTQRGEDVMLGDGEFWFATPAGVRFHYRLGEGVVAEVPPGPSAEDDFRIFLWGTVFGAVAWLNGFFPLHASAVVVRRRLAAFTADSGGGKSTLAAALSARGYPHVCDDTLALVRTEEGILGVPDRKSLKLWVDAAAFLGSKTTGAIHGLPGKMFAEAPLRSEEALPLRDLFVLKPAASITLRPLAGAGDRLEVIVEAMYRPGIPAVVQDRHAHAAWLMELVKSVRIWLLERPTDALRQPDIDTIAALIDDLPPS